MSLRGALRAQAYDCQLYWMGRYYSVTLRLADAWGTFFRGSETHIYYVDQLEHPKELSGSHLEQERSQLGYKSAFGVRRTVALVKRRFSRIARKLGALMCLAQGYRRIVR